MLLEDFTEAERVLETSQNICLRASYTSVLGPLKTNVSDLPTPALQFIVVLHSFVGLVVEIEYSHDVPATESQGELKPCAP